MPVTENVDDEFGEISTGEMGDRIAAPKAKIQFKNNKRAVGHTEEIDIHRADEADRLGKPMPQLEHVGVIDGNRLFRFTQSRFDLPPGRHF
jgi:hypothetical protein